MYFVEGKTFSIPKKSNDSERPKKNVKIIILQTKTVNSFKGFCIERKFG